MATAFSTALPTDWTFADVQSHLGGIPLERIRSYPPAGMATEKDVLEAESRFSRICELIDGVLVEKTLGYYESLVAVAIIQFLGRFLERNDLGIVLGEAGTLKILPDQVRIPDVSFIAWEKFPNRQLPREPIPEVVPDLAVEVLSENNTEAEMQRKLKDYFTAGVRLVWYIEARTKTARAYTAPDCCTAVGAEESLAGGDVLPGFEVSLKDLFAKAGSREGETPAEP
jgi:Uma2 family endonuclease